MTKEWVFFKDQWDTPYRANLRSGHIQFYDQGRWYSSGYGNISYLKAKSMNSYEPAKFLFRAFENAMKEIKAHPVEVF